MDRADVWDVDLLAAAELFAFLQKVSQAEWLDLFAQAFAKARLKNYEWAAQRVRETIIEILEAEAIEEFQRKEMMWTDGYRHAEKCIMAQTPSELLRVCSGLPKSKGQILRSLMRSSRR